MATYPISTPVMMGLLAGGLTIPCGAWELDLNGTDSIYFDSADHLVVDVAGDVIAAGVLADLSTNSLHQIVKIDGNTGIELWRTPFESPIPAPNPGNHNQIKAIAVDNNGDVLVAGRLFGGLRVTPNLSLEHTDFGVAKYDGSTGEIIWRVQYDGGASNFIEEARAIVVAENGDAIVTGELNYGSFIQRDMVTIRLDADDGSKVWLTNIDGEENYSADTGNAVGLDSNGDVIVAGEIGGDPIIGTFGADRDFGVAKLAGDTGVELWRTLLKGALPQPQLDSAVHVAIDANDDVIAGGRIAQTVASGDAFVAKLYGTDGKESWRFIGPPGVVFRQALDANGDLAIAVTGLKTELRKLLGATGVTAWQLPLPGSDVAFDQYDDLLTGRGQVLSTSPLDVVFQVEKRDGTSGAILWSGQFPGDIVPGRGVPRRFAVDANSDVLAAGQRQNTSNDRDFTVIKLNGLDGSDFEGNTDGDNDGVADENDLCLNTLPDMIVDSNGCSIDQLVPCEGPFGTTENWRNHGQYVSMVARTAESFLGQGLISEAEKDAIVSMAAQSSCGQR